MFLQGTENKALGGWHPGFPNIAKGMAPRLWAVTPSCQFYFDSNEMTGRSQADGRVTGEDEGESRGHPASTRWEPEVQEPGGTWAARSSVGLWKDCFLSDPSLLEKGESLRRSLHVPSSAWKQNTPNC